MDKKTRKKQEIIEKSIGVMFKNGYNGTGVKDITDAAGIPKGSLYNYFENKEDYAKEALNHYYREINKQNFKILDDKNLNPLDRIKQFYESMIDEFTDLSNCELGCFVGNMTQEMAGISNIIKETTNEIHNEITQKIKNCLIEALEKRDISKNKNLDELSQFITSSWQGSLLGIKATNNSQILNSFYKILVEVLLK
ncbi:TetR/AcrR family transcriptional regulator [Mycoplasmatota bacterium zrk1]